MSGKRTNTSSKFKRLLGWTVLMAVVFSAGLITGERLVRKQNLAPLVSVTDQAPLAERSAAQADDSADSPESAPTSLSFFDKLTQRDAVALSANKQSDGEDAPSQPDPPVESTSPSASSDQQPAPDDVPDDEADEADEPAEAEADPTESVEEDAAPSPADEAPAAEAGEDAEQTKQQDTAARYTLQVAAHPDMDSARKHMKRLRTMGLEPHLVSAAIPGKGEFYRVRVGKFGSMDEARSFQSDLERKNSLSTFVSPL
jgi:DedD protein